MAITYYVGSIPAYCEELRQKSSQLSDIIHNKSVAKIEFRNGVFDLNGAQSKHPQSVSSFSDIGLGKPLSIEIMSSYSGDVPKKFLGRRPDVMTFSGVKSYLEHAASARMINHIQERAEDYSYMDIGAFEKGSPIVFYTPALHFGSLLCSFELVADTFGKSFSKALTKLFAHAGSLPIFAPAAPFLLAGSIASRYTGKTLHNIFESKAFLSEDITLRFDTPEFPMAVARQWLVCNQKDQDPLMEYAPGFIAGPDGRQVLKLVHRKTGKVYKGKAPFMIVNIDGRDRPELEAFKSKAASAKVLEQFYGNNKSSELNLSILEEALSLYNDFYYLDKIKNIQLSTGTLDKGKDQETEVELLMESYKNNIQRKEILNLQI